MKNPIDAYRLRRRLGLRWRICWKAADDIRPETLTAAAMTIMALGLGLWVLAAYSVAALAADVTETKDTQIAAERARADFYERQIIDCLNWKVMEINGVIFDCKMKELKK